MEEATKKNAQDRVMSLSCEELSLIKPGWYWYEDESFSPVLQTEKKLKAVVVLIEYSTIYGDVFMEEIRSLKETKAFLNACRKNLGEMVYLPTLKEHIEIGEHIDEINRALDRIGNVPLWEGTYMTGTQYSCYQTWIKTHPHGSYGAGYRGTSYKIRPLICRSID